MKRALPIFFAIPPLLVVLALATEPPPLPETCGGSSWTITPSSIIARVPWCDAAVPRAAWLYLRDSADYGATNWNALDRDTQRMQLDLSKSLYDNAPAQFPLAASRFDAVVAAFDQAVNAPAAEFQAKHALFKTAVQEFGDRNRPYYSGVLQLRTRIVDGSDSGPRGRRGTQDFSGEGTTMSEVRPMFMLGRSGGPNEEGRRGLDTAITTARENWISILKGMDENKHDFMVEFTSRSWVMFKQLESLSQLSGDALQTRRGDLQREASRLSDMRQGIQRLAQDDMAGGTAVLHNRLDAVFGEDRAGRDMGGVQAVARIEDGVYTRRYMTGADYQRYLDAKRAAAQGGTPPNPDDYAIKDASGTVIKFSAPLGPGSTMDQIERLEAAARAREGGPQGLWSQVQERARITAEAAADPAHSERDPNSQEHPQGNQAANSWVQNMYAEGHSREEIDEKIADHRSDAQSRYTRDLASLTQDCQEALREHMGRLTATATTDQANAAREAAYAECERTRRLDEIRTSSATASEWADTRRDAHQQFRAGTAAARRNDYTRRIEAQRASISQEQVRDYPQVEGNFDGGSANAKHAQYQAVVGALSTPRQALLSSYDNAATELANERSAFHRQVTEGSDTIADIFNRRHRDALAAYRRLADCVVQACSESSCPQRGRCGRSGRPD